MTAEQFLLSLRRFIARRGKPTNSPQFELAKTANDKAWKETISHHEVQSYTANQGIEWNFIVGTVKGALKKSINKICLTEKKLETFLAEAEAVTPADFLGLNPKTGILVIEIRGPHDPDYGKKSSTDKLVEIWGKGQQHLNSLWRVWKDDYLLALRERRQTHVKAPRIQAAEKPKVVAV